jgi:hypothetical protein
MVFFEGLPGSAMRYRKCFPTNPRKALMNRTIFAAALACLAAATAAAEVKETVELTVTGGPNAGKHQASTERGGCTYGFAGPGSWGNQLSDAKDKDPKKFNSLQLIVPNAKAAAAGTTEFELTVGFGPLMNRSATYTVNTRAGKKAGSGSVTVVDKGNTGEVKFSAVTAEGVKLEGRIDCKSVMRSGS